MEYAHQAISVYWLMSIGSWNTLVAQSSAATTVVDVAGAVTVCATT